MGGRAAIAYFVAGALALAVAAPALAGPAEDEALLSAAYNLDLPAVKAALAKGASPNAHRGRTALGGRGLEYFGHV
jgi:hypothetical protein